MRRRTPLIPLAVLTLACASAPAAYAALPTLSCDGAFSVLSGQSTTFSCSGSMSLLDGEITASERLRIVAGLNLNLVGVKLYAPLIELQAEHQLALGNGTELQAPGGYISLIAGAVINVAGTADDPLNAVGHAARISLVDHNTQLHWSPITVSSVPEPSTWLTLLCAGLALLQSARWRL